MRYEIFREAENIQKLREAYEVHGPRSKFPPDEIILAIAEEIIAGEYKRPKHGDLYKNSFGERKK